MPAISRPPGFLAGAVAGSGVDDHDVLWAENDRRPDDLAAARPRRRSHRDVQGDPGRPGPGRHRSCTRSGVTPRPGGTQPMAMLAVSYPLGLPHPTASRPLGIPRLAVTQGELPELQRPQLTRAARSAHHRPAGRPRRHLGGQDRSGDPVRRSHLAITALRTPGCPHAVTATGTDSARPSSPPSPTPTAARSPRTPSPRAACVSGSVSRTGLVRGRMRGQRRVPR
jgi:hypothetical protein